jgi:hypothetical protein
VSKNQKILRGASVKKASFFCTYRPLTTFLIILILNSCISFKPNANKSAKTLFTTFYLGENGTQYFIKPLSLTNNANESIILDFTFRDQVQNTDSLSVNINSSLITNTIVTKIDSMTIHCISHHFTLHSPQLLYKEKKDNKYLLRTQVKTSFKNVSELFGEINWQIQVHSGKTQMNFSATKKTNKSVPLLYTSIFELITTQ